MNALSDHQHNPKWRSVYRTGAIFTFFVLIGIIVDLIAGFSIGGNITRLPPTSIGRFEQLHQNPLVGLYNLDLLNAVNQLLLIPSFFALYAIHRHGSKGQALLALIIFLTGTVIFVLNNSALIMLDLSNKYFAASSDSQKILYAAAGEGMLARGEHGGLNVFAGFLLPNIGGLMISFVMLKSGIFSRATAHLGIWGSILIIIYVILVTFVPAVKSFATILAAPGGLLLMIWMILYAVRLFKLAGEENV